MKQLKSYINIRKNRTRIVADDSNIFDIINNAIDHKFDSSKDIVDLNYIDVSRVTKMYSISDGGLFEGLYDFNADISEWDVSNVVTFERMFYGCRIFNQDISKWDTSSAENMCYMFRDCKKFNQDLNDWDVSNVKTMEFMFRSCEKFNKSLSRWKVNKCENFTRMFSYCFDLKQDFSSWNVSSSALTNYMFWDCPTGAMPEWIPKNAENVS